MTAGTLVERILGAVRPVPGDSISLLSASTAILSASAVYLYFAGYIFEFFYYRAFGVSVDSLDISPQYYFIHAYTIFETTRGLLILGFLLLMVSGYAAGKIRRGLLVVSMIAAFPLVFFVANSEAQRASDLTRTHPNQSVKFSFKDSAKGAADHLAQLAGEGKLFLLLETKDRIIVFWQPDALAPGMNPSVSVYTIMRSDLNWSEVIAP